MTMPHIADEWTRSSRNPRHGSLAWSKPTSPLHHSLSSGEISERLPLVTDAPRLPHGSGPPFTLTLFLLMSYAPTFDNAVFLVEEILADRAVPFPLSAVESLPKLVDMTLETPAKLAFFCRVLALTVLDAEERGVAADPSEIDVEFDDDQMSQKLAAMLRRDVCLYSKTDHFLLKIDDFLLENDDCLLKIDSFLLKNDHFLLKIDDFLLKTDGVQHKVEGEASEISHANQRLLLELPGFMERVRWIDFAVSLRLIWAYLRLIWACLDAQLLAILKPPQPHASPRKYRRRLDPSIENEDSSIGNDRPRLIYSGRSLRERVWFQLRWPKLVAVRAQASSILWRRMAWICWSKRTTRRLVRDKCLWRRRWARGARWSRSVFYERILINIIRILISF